MKKIFSVVALFAALAATPASAGTIDYEWDYEKSCSTWSLYLCQPLAGKTGSFAYVAKTVGWSEAYAGLSYNPTTYLSFTFGLGEESGTSKTRTGGSVWIGKDKASALLLFEDGGSGEWRKLVVKYQLTPTISVGHVQKTWAGQGLYLEYAPSPSMTLKFAGFAKPQFTVIKTVKF